MCVVLGVANICPPNLPIKLIQMKFENHYGVSTSMLTSTALRDASCSKALAVMGT